MTDDLSVTPDVANQEVKSQPQIGSKEYNFDRLRREKEDLERQLWQERQEKLMMQNAAKPAPDEQFDFKQLEQEEFPDGKKLAKAFGSFNSQLAGLQKGLKEKDQKIALLETAIQFKDFAEVVTDENIEKYIKSDDDLFDAVRTASNPGKRAYNLIKKNADYQASLSKKKAPSQEEKRIADKETAPKTSSLNSGVRSEAITSVGQYSKMSKDQKNALWAEVQRFARR